MAITGQGLIQIFQPAHRQEIQLVTEVLQPNNNQITFIPIKAEMYTRETITEAGTRDRETAGNRQTNRETVHQPGPVTQLTEPQQDLQHSLQQAGAILTDRQQAGTGVLQEQIITVIIPLHPGHQPEATAAEQQEAVDFQEEVAADADKVFL